VKRVDKLCCIMSKMDHNGMTRYCPSCKMIGCEPCVIEADCGAWDHGRFGYLPEFGWYPEGHGKNGRKRL